MPVTAMNLQPIDYLAKGGKYQPETIIGHTLTLLEELKLLETAYPVVADKTSVPLLRMASLYHDLGKANHLFQDKLATGTWGMLPDEVYHEYLSVAMIPTKALLANGWTQDDVTILCSAIVNHHNRGLNVDQVTYKREIEALNNQLPHLAWGALGIPASTDAKRPSVRYTKSSAQLMRSPNYKDYVVLKGLLNRLDYSASGHYPIEKGSRNLVPLAKENILRKWREVNPLANWNQMQMYLKEHEGENLALIATTGSGKTEGALNWLGTAKAFYVLPLRTSLNLMYQRLDNAMNNTDDLGLLHADSYAFLSDEADKEGSTVQTVADDEFDGTDTLLEVDESDTASLEDESDESDDLTSAKVTDDGLAKVMDHVVASANLSLPVTLTTADQLFKTVFRYRNYERVLATLSYSRVVVDELQVYDASLLAYVIAGLEQVKAVGGKYLIMTATLPPFVQDLLMEHNLIDGEPQQYLTDNIRHSINLVKDQLTVGAVAQHYQVSQDKTLVIVNTVKKAQELAIGLRELFGKEVHLIHSRFTRGDLADKSGELMAFNTNRNAKGIWISTQMLESSADIDFDYLLTEFSELSGLFQRMGRVYRNRILVDPTKSNIECYLGNPTISSYPSGVSDDERHPQVVAYSLYELGRQVLLAHGNGQVTEQDKQDMLSVYTTANLKGTQYYKMIQRSFGMLALKEATESGMSKAQAQQYFRPMDNYNVIPVQVYEQNLDKITAYANKLDDPDLSYYQKHRIITKLSDYLVTIPGYMYTRLDKQGKLTKLSFGRRDYIVANAKYDDDGFRLTN